MGLDYFTVSQLGAELHQILPGRFISGASYSDGSLKLKIEQSGMLSFQCKPNGLILYAADNANVLPWPSKDDPVKYFIGARFIGVSLPESDRTLSFILERFNQKIGGRLFEIRSWEAKDLLKKKANLLKED